LFDVSIVGVGAYANTDVALRSLEQIKTDAKELEAKINSDSEETLRKINQLQNELKLKSKF
jgi:phage head maturation protease